MENAFKEQENQLRSKYGNIEKRNGSILLRKKLQGSGRKYFDSGDYNMQKEAIKPASRISTIPEPPTEELPPGLIPDKRTSPNGIHQEKSALQPRKSTDSPLTRA